MTASGALKSGALEGRSASEVLEHLRRLGLTPIDIAQNRIASAGPRPIRRAALSRTVAELAVLLNAGMHMDRALAIVCEDMQAPAERAAFELLRTSVREGRPLSRAMADAAPAFPPMASAMTAAGEADGRPAAALARLAETLERAEALHVAVVSAMIYPALLTLIAFSVIGLMLFWVVPQFETLFTDAGDNLPTMTRVVVTTSHVARQYGLFGLLGALLAGFAGWRLFCNPAYRKRFDRAVLKLPRLGKLIALTECARLVRVLASLVEGGVVLPEALALARKSLQNKHMSDVVDGVARGLREGGGLTEPLAATGVFPKLAISYLRTGEQTAQLPLMLNRLADALEREVRTDLERITAVLTPLMTVVMGAVVALVIASIMTAILGFDDLALTK
jgi:general secretion pathway protein F